MKTDASKSLDYLSVEQRENAALAECTQNSYGAIIYDTVVALAMAQNERIKSAKALIDPGNLGAAKTVTPD